MARRRNRWRWLIAAVGIVQLATVPCPAQPPPAPPPEKIEQDKDLPMKDAAAPEIALLDFLGRYEEAAEGVDPLGLAGVDAAAGTPADGGERKGGGR